MMDPPHIQYVKTTDGVRIAYCVMGSGPVFIFDSGYPFNHLTASMEIETNLTFFERLASNCTLVRLDHRATGLSQRDAFPSSLDDLVADLDAVAAAVGADRFTLGGSSFGGPTVASFALRHSHQISKLLLFNTSTLSPFESGSGVARGQYLFDLATNDWELFTETAASVLFGWREGEGARKMAHFLRESTSPAGVISFAELRSEDNWPELIGELGLPTLVLKHEESFFVSMEVASELTARIPGAELVLLEGPYVTTNERAIRAADVVLDFIEGVGEPRANASQERASLRTVLFTDLVGHTEMMSRLGDERGREVLREHERITRDVLKAHGGTEVKTMGDGFMASFGSVTRAVECGIALQRAVEARNKELGTGILAEPIAVRCGLNAGEPIEEEGDLFGATVILASRIAAKADGGEILVADTVRGLCSGKGFLFADRGEFVAKGFEEPVRVHEVRWREE